MDRTVPILAGDKPALATSTPASVASPLRGSVLVLIQFDVCEEIRLDELRNIFGARTADASFKQKAPAYVRYQRPPVEETLEPLVLESGERLAGEIKYYDYGVVSLVFELAVLRRIGTRWSSSPAAGPPTPTSKSWPRASSSRSWSAPLPRWSSLTLKQGEWLQEDYFIFHVREIAGAPVRQRPAHRLCATAISQVVRGEMAPLSDDERQEILHSRISYYPNDLAVIGWNAAFIYDTRAGAETAIQLLQYANSQLLEFRHYDELLTKELENVYDFLDRGAGWWSRWRTAKAASKLHTVLLDVTNSPSAPTTPSSS